LDQRRFYEPGCLQEDEHGCFGIGQKLCYTLFRKLPVTFRLAIALDHSAEPYLLLSDFGIEDVQHVAQATLIISANSPGSATLAASRQVVLVQEECDPYVQKEQLREACSYSHGYDGLAGWM